MLLCYNKPMLHPLKQAAIFVVLEYFKWWAKVALALNGKVVTIGIAGSVGKSSTKQILYAMLRNHATVAMTKGNSETGVPLGILGLDIPSGSPSSWLKAILIAPLSIFHLRQTTHLIIEMGTDSPDWPKNMDHLLTIVKPDYSLWLNVHPVHTEQFSTHAPSNLNTEQKADFALSTLAQEDGKIITKNPTTVGIYNADDEAIGQQILDYLQTEPLGKLLAFGNQPDTEIKYGAYHISPTGSTFELIVDGQAYTMAIDKYLLPQVYQQCLAAALLVGMQFNIPIPDLISSLQQHLQLDAGRSSLFKGRQEAIIIDSTYNASTASVLAFVDMLRQLKDQSGRPAVVILGDMREIGPATAAEHAQVAQALAGVVDQVYLVGPLTQQHLQPVLADQAPQLPVTWFANYQDLANTLTTALPDKALVLAKGSQNTIFLEEAVKALLADPTDAARLCRQQPYWQKRKTAWLTSYK